MEVFVIVKKVDNKKHYRSFSNYWVEIKDGQTKYPLKSYISMDDAEGSKYHIQNKEREDNLTIEKINIKRLGYYNES